MRYKMKLQFFLSVLCLLTHQMLSAQIDTCICGRFSDDCKSKDNYELITQKFMVKPECNGQAAVYKDITKKVMKSLCCPRWIEYPCDCKEKKKRREVREELIPAENVTLLKYDCDGKITTELVQIKAESKRLIYDVVPELKRK
jgi:hypothetical protein